MAINSATRKKMEALVYQVFDTLDKTGENSKKYRTFFRQMSDKQFSDYMNKFLADDDQNFRLEVLPFKNEPSFEDIEKAAKLINCPLEEYVYWNDNLVDGKPLRTPMRVPVGYMDIRRQQQIIAKKTSLSMDIKSRSSITNQVIGDSKTAKNSDVESYALLFQDNDNILKEFLGPRADNSGQKRAMYNEISRDGFSKLETIRQNDSIFEKNTVNAFDVYLLGAGIKSDLITDGSKLAVSLTGGIDL